jgi:hypothetical protein
MNKYNVEFREALRYDREFEIEVPDNIGEDELESIMNAAQRKASNYEDFGFAYDVFGIYGIKVTERADESMDSPQRCEYEIFDFYKK